ncbi:thioredoxin [Lutibaculum baratangense]|uniref:Thioredoxin n=1 Tax=Lutibaculum baratangense AMV1 TaxID=631454 RepID=V4QW23_9HYPH|nr:thioredoxin [Lutibaculum baratangense]ESR23912.1 Thioredoxin domain-containing protein EC-YbbN [Lutibaculum baratangense AMV1]
MELFSTGQAAAPAGGDLIKDTTTQGFMADVVEASQQVPVLVDFWAPWCGPCKQLTPLLEKVVREAKGKVKLVKMNIDEHPAVAQQMGVQSIPAVFAFVDGRPVDGFMGALPESQLKQFIDRLAGPDGGAEDPEAQALEMADAALEAGDLQQAAAAYGAVLQANRENLAALGGLAKTLVRAGELDRARQTLDTVPADKQGDAAIASARAELDLAEQAASLGDLSELANRIEANPEDHEARFELALALNAHGDRGDAVNHLIEIVRRDRAWNDDGARKQLLQFFEAWGPKDPATLSGRRKLSSVLFS